MKSLEKLLIEEYNISSTDIEKAEQYQQRFGGRIEQILVNMGSLSEDDLPQLYATLYDIPRLELTSWDNVKLPETPQCDFDFLLSKDWILLATENNESSYLCTYPLDIEVNEFLSRKGEKYNVLVGTQSDIQYFAAKKEALSESVSELDILSGDEEEKLKELASEAPTVNLLNSLITKGIKLGASDMHLEPVDGRYRVRYRTDGVLHEAETINKKLQLPIITRLKILSGMDIAEKRRPQDGKIEMRVANQELDIRVSSLPLNEGESVVMRFLRKDNVTYDMSTLGLTSDIDTLIREDIKTTAGVVLLTGPTGSGKTTTLYTFLNSLNNEDVKIITLEDPVEYQLRGINQVQVNSEIGFTFAAGLRSIVRQDPDIIMLGEIRDKETAQIALQSALTGHLVFSTVHTNDAPSAYTRLLDLGVEEFLLNAALVSIVAQRLARKVCKHCAQPDPQAAELIEKYNLLSFKQNFSLPTIELVKGVGCDNCSHTGYKGRLAVTEYLRCDHDIQAMPKDADFIAKAKAHNKQLKRRNLIEDGLYKACLGLTTVDEVLRVAG